MRTHARRRPLARAPRGARRRATPSPTRTLRAEQVVDWATRGGARALGRDDLGSLEPGQEGRRRPDQERRLAGVVPAAQPLRPRGLPGPARRRAHRRRRRPGREERGHRLVGVDLRRRADRDRETVDHLRSAMGEDAWQQGMNPELPETRRSSTTPTSTPTTSPTRPARPAARSSASRAPARSRAMSLARSRGVGGRTRQRTRLRRGAGARARRARGASGAPPVR